MKLTICAPNHSYLQPILANASMYCAEHGHNFIEMSEKQCIDALYTGKADIALINPLDFALSKSQILIIPTFAVFAESYSGISSIHFSNRSSSMETIGLESDDFLMNIGLIGLIEKYDLLMQKHIIQSNIDKTTILEHYDSAILWNAESMIPGALDITEEWSDYNDFPLPIAFWACKDEDFTVDLMEITTQLAADDLPDIETIKDSAEYEEEFGRIGSLLYHWKDDFKEHIMSIQHVLYYHQMIPEIRDVHILG